MVNRQWAWSGRLIAFLGVLLLVGSACGPTPAAAPSKPAAAPSGAGAAPAGGGAPGSASGTTAGTAASNAPAGWEQTVAAAKQEGKLALSGPPGQLWRDALVAFEKDYPEIKVEFTGQNS